MATSARGGMKDFFKQKKSSGISKPNKSSTRKSKSPAISSKSGSEPANLISHGSPNPKDDYDESEKVLRQFDVNMAYGPCLGMTRIARWERARNLGLSPPKDIETLLKSGKVQLECLWDNRV